MNKLRALTFAAVFSLSGHLPVGQFHGSQGEREIASAFSVANRSDSVDILSEYRVYFDFVVRAARASSPKWASQMSDEFRKLERQNPDYAAKFLKGLRFEVDQKFSMMGWRDGHRVVNSPVVQRWVAHFAPVWAKELDEYRFRAYTDSKLLARK